MNKQLYNTLDCHKDGSLNILAYYGLIKINTLPISVIHQSNSHILPLFITKWQRKTKHSGYNKNKDPCMKCNTINNRMHDMQPWILQNQDLRNFPFGHSGTKKDYNPKTISPIFCLTRTKSKQRKQITIFPKKKKNCPEKNCLSNKNNG